ncbi:MAG: hypothetical protein LBT00_15035 [Spirochaetaceae bacterium]|nr:hypothetical protein [Spirochaetaceae bacterium]
MAATWDTARHCEPAACHCERSAAIQGERPSSGLLPRFAPRNDNGSRVIAGEPPRHCGPGPPSLRASPLRHCERSAAIQGERPPSGLLRRFASCNDDAPSLRQAPSSLRAKRSNLEGERPSSRLLRRFAPRNDGAASSLRPSPTRHCERSAAIQSKSLLPQNGARCPFMPQPAQGPPRQVGQGALCA